MSIRIRSMVIGFCIMFVLQLMSVTSVAAQQCTNGWTENYTIEGVFLNCSPPVVSQTNAGTPGASPTNTGTPGVSQTNAGTPGASPTNTGTPGTSQTNTSGATKVMSLINPIKCSAAAEQKGECLIEFLLAIISVLLLFALPIIIFFIMYAGFQFVTAAGNESKVSAAKSTLLWAVIGGVIILGSKLIITVIQGTITAFGQ